MGGCLLACERIGKYGVAVLILLNSYLHIVIIIIFFFFDSYLFMSPQLKRL